jgi:glycosyltransferase involved in cell wall biosynthesis
MKKKLLFTCGPMSCGGVQKSLLALLSQLDYSKYEVDLMLTKKTGELLSLVPSNINIIEPPEYFKYAYFDKKTLSKSLLYFMKDSSNFHKYLFSLSYGIINRNKKKARQKHWSYYNDIIPNLSKEYYAAIAYAGGVLGYFIIDKVKAEKKYCWIHGNYEKFNNDLSIDKYYFNKFDKVITVSSKCKEIIDSYFPELKKQTLVIHNIVSRNEIHKLADSGSGFEDEFIGKRIISVARLDKGKGFDIAIEAFNKIIKDGYPVKWHIVGEGSEKKKLLALVESYNLTNNVIFEGLKTNPYSYIKESDIFLHPSLGEGKSMSVDEAKILEKPILITDYPTVRDQIVNEVTGLIVPISVEGLYKGLNRILNDLELCSKLKNNLKGFEPENIKSKQDIISLL